LRGHHDRKLAQVKVQAQLARLNLLHQITELSASGRTSRASFRSSSERSKSICRWISAASACMTRPRICVIVTSVGSHSEALAMERR